ncbi:hypothetical protein [Haloarchaeobius sp. HRN-SO-5]|uniref:hypothetical protein n=1 Tax=Haloarchaeobius sp. HRN-SO-5 TaxID=3446118 RepID=UPI003EB9CF13
MPSVSRRAVLTAAVAGLAGCTGTFDTVEPPGTHPPDAVLRLEVVRPGRRGERVYVHNDGEVEVEMRGYVLEYDDGFVHEFDRLTLSPGGWVAVESTSVVEAVQRSEPKKYLRGANRDERLCPGGRVTLVGPGGTLVDSTTCGQG